MMQKLHTMIAHIWHKGRTLQTVIFFSSKAQLGSNKPKHLVYDNNSPITTLNNASLFIQRILCSHG